MRAIDPAGRKVDTAEVGVAWWWQHNDTESIAAVRQTCARNALAEVAVHSRDPEVQFAVGRVVGAYAASLNRTRHQLQWDGGLSRQNTLDWAQICPASAVQEAVDALWRLVLTRLRGAWEAEREALLAKWADPTSPLHDLRKRLLSGGE